MCEAVAEQPVVLESVALKICSKCHIALPLTEFNTDNNTKDKLNSSCRKCRSKSQKAHRERNKSRDTVVPPGLKVCCTCGLEKPSFQFSKTGSNKDGLSYSCKECAAKNSKKNGEKNKAREIIVIPEYRTCTGCSLIKPGSSFYKSSSEKDGIATCCKECHAIRQRLYKFHLTDEQYQAMLLAQGGACAICKFIPGPEDNRLCVDHIHGTDIVRGLLCGKCNPALGQFEDSLELLGKAIEHLTIPTLDVVYKPWLYREITGRILTAQNYMCKICSTDLRNKRACLDHDHITGMVRGYLCFSCNLGLGQFNDCIEILANAIFYLGKHKPNCPRSPREVVTIHLC